MTSALRLLLLLTSLSTPLPAVTAAQPALLPTVSASSAPSSASAHPDAGGRWNDPRDVARVATAFETWTAAVLARNLPVVLSFHDEGFRAGMGAKTLDKAGHVKVQMTVGNREMRLVAAPQTRRLGSLLLVWSQHFIRADPVPEIPELGLVGDWGGREAAKRGFVQNEFSVWHDDGQRLTCLSFSAARVAS